MSLTSVLFLFFFLPVSLFLYRLLQNRNRTANLLLLIASLLFYAWDSVQNTLLLLIVIVWCWASGLELAGMKPGSQKRKTALIGSAAVPIAILAFYKYIGLFLPSIQTGFPLGLSFYIFSAISYIADVYMEKAAPCSSLLDTGLYLAFFGKVSMGPITQYHDFADQIAHRKISRDKIGKGAVQMICGLAKKVILADQLALVFASLGQDHSFLGCWVMMIAYTLQLYFDFSGYSDMAIGISRMFGFDLPANFRYPYTAKSIQDFWRRWHISLSQWFRDYVYIPLGGSRCSAAQYIRNIFIVWILTGIWHGSTWTFVLWGIYYALLLLAERYIFKDLLARIPNALRVTGTFVLVLFGWVFFTQPNILAALDVFKGLFGLSGQFASQASLYALTSSWFLMLLAFVFCADRTPLYDRICLRIGKQRGDLVQTAGYVILFFISVMFIVMSTSQTFLYAQF